MRNSRQCSITGIFHSQHHYPFPLCAIHFANNSSFFEFREMRLYSNLVSENEGFMALLNKYSIIQAATVELLAIGVSMYGFTRASWGTKLSRAMIESSVLSLSLLILLLEKSIRSQLEILKDKVIPITSVSEEIKGNKAEEEAKQILPNEVQADRMELTHNNSRRIDMSMLAISQRELLVKIEKVKAKTKKVQEDLMLEGLSEKKLREGNFGIEAEPMDMKMPIIPKDLICQQAIN
eukprot:TRINITY_DN1377_c0_g5_i1.p2 TRINITY_DN1377_c0_g5~~TRINITY_DN1377_c0_g5_i1.p2  ORF type:complete len:236 (+),score=47.48 TRINITY_DN1377_c0_g5_i1:1119-1826(+)